MGVVCGRRGWGWPHEHGHGAPHGRRSHPGCGACERWYQLAAATVAAYHTRRHWGGPGRLADAVDCPDPEQLVMF